MKTDAKKHSERLLEIRTVEVISGKGRTVTLSSVRCPVRSRSAAVEECADCGRSAGVAQDALARGQYLACRTAAPARRPGAGPAETALVAEVMRRTSVALRPAVTRGVAADALRSRGLAAAPVVDGEGRPIGVVGEVDLLRAKAGAKVADAMAKVALSVPEVAPLARAAAIMAEHRAERLPVVADDGAVVGMITAMDVVAWLAGAGGPLAPEETSGAQPGAR